MGMSVGMVRAIGEHGARILGPADWGWFWVCNACKVRSRVAFPTKERALKGAYGHLVNVYRKAK